jgi:hypothetical protein
MHATASSHTRHDGLTLLVARAAFFAGATGVALGVWCRSFVEGAAGAFGVSVAELGAPWVVAAFAVGAVVAVHPVDDPPPELARLGLGAAAGAAAMVVASFVYYGNTSSTSAVFWAAVGVIVGGAAGAAGAAWRVHRDDAVQALAAGVLGLALVAEGIGRRDFGWFHIAGGLSYLTAGWLVVAGVAIPVLLTRGRPFGFAASIAALGLAGPVAALVVAASHGLGIA